MNIPRHVAIILDGNGRWAKSKGMPRNYGHAQGSKTVEKICEEAWKDGNKVSYRLMLFHGELEAPAGGGFRHRGPAEKVSAGVHRKDGEGQN